MVAWGLVLANYILIDRLFYFHLLKLPNRSVPAVLGLTWEECVTLWIPLCLHSHLKFTCQSLSIHNLLYSVCYIIEIKIISCCPELNESWGSLVNKICKMPTLQLVIRSFLVHSDTEYRPIEFPVSHLLQNLDQSVAFCATSLFTIGWWSVHNSLLMYSESLNPISKFPQQRRRWKSVPQNKF